MKHSHRFSTQDVPPPRGKVFKVVTVAPGASDNLVVLAEKPFGIMTHYGNHRTHPCSKPHDACPGHIAQWPLRWKGYLFVMNPRITRPPFFLGLTPLSMEDLVRAKGERKSCRGMIVNVFREGKHKNSPLAINWVGEHMGENPLPPDEDPMPTLLRIWGLDGIS